MNYRHAFHAGSFADVLKHATLVPHFESLTPTQEPAATILPGRRQVAAANGEMALPGC
jgi:23S rRNA A2030 N6-methylase RlmJ